MTPRTDYAVTNYLGVTIRTFGDRQSAIAWADEHASEHEGLVVDRVTYSIRRTSVYRPASEQVAA